MTASSPPARPLRAGEAEAPRHMRLRPADPHTYVPSRLSGKTLRLKDLGDTTRQNRLSRGDKMHLKHTSMAGVVL